MLCLVAQSCLTLCNHMDCSLPGSICPWGFSRQEYWSGLPCPPPRDLPNPGIEPRSPSLQEDSLPAEPQGKPDLISEIRLSRAGDQSRGERALFPATTSIGIHTEDEWRGSQCWVSGGPGAPFWELHLRVRGSPPVSSARARGILILKVLSFLLNTEEKGTYSFRLEKMF